MDICNILGKYYENLTDHFPDKTGHSTDFRFNLFVRISNFIYEGPSTIVVDGLFDLTGDCYGTIIVTRMVPAVAG